jgi:hypothetical protein
MITQDAEGDDIAYWLKFAAPEMIENLKPLTAAQLLTMLEGIPVMKHALEGKDGFRIAQDFLYYCRTGEAPEAADEAPADPVPTN